MLTITAICDQYAWLYQDAIPEPPGTWDHVLGIDGSYTAIKRVDVIDYVMFRGSTTFKDWWQDFDDFAIQAQDPVLGGLHPGARDGVIVVKYKIDALVGDKVVIVGHSLGAMHAAIYAGYRVAAGKTVNALVMFGEPRSGGPQLSAILAKTPVQSFRNAGDGGYDLVTAVARSLPPLLNYQHVRDPITDCNFPPPWNDRWGIFSWHHFSLYCKAFGAAGPAVLALR